MQRLKEFMKRCYEGGVEFTRGLSPSRMTAVLDAGLAFLFGWAAYTTGATFYAGITGAPVPTAMFVLSIVSLPVHAIVGVPGTVGLLRAICNKSGRAGEKVVRAAQYTRYDVPEHVRSFGRSLKRGGQKLTSAFEPKAKRPDEKPIYQSNNFTFGPSKKPGSDN